MKITFIFTDKPDLTQVPSVDRYNTYFELPDAAKSISDIQTQVIAIAELVGEFTRTSLHLSCSDIGLKNYAIKQINEPENFGQSLHFSFRAICLYFEGRFRNTHGAIYAGRRTLTILSPIQSNFSMYGGGYQDIRSLKTWRDAEMVAFGERIQTLSERLLLLLNVDGDWRFQSFHPWAKQPRMITRSNRRSQKWRAEQRKREREEEKRKQREAKLAEKPPTNPQQPLTHGAGRTVGARPGIYKGIQMRSQLEIRFAAELDERNIKWIYEGEALGDSSYLVDFYLPDLGVWVEVKGKFEARDRQVLPEVARVLKTERKQRLLVYTSTGKCCVVNPSGFREVERKNFWTELLR